MRAGAKLPVRVHKTDAGMDLFFCPNGCRGVCYEESGEYWIPPKQSSLISTGLKAEIPEGYMLEVKNRSSVASKRSLIVGACVIDSGYDGEVFINLHNVGNTAQIVEHGTKIAQVVMIPVVHFRALETHSKDLYDWYPITFNGRGDGALGSTGK